MRTPLRRAFAASLLTLTLTITAPQARAWGATGHEAIAWVAWQQMKPATQARVMQLLALVPTLTHVTAGVTKTIPGYPDWVKDLPAGLTPAQKNLYLFMRASTWADTIKHQWLTDSDKPPPHVTVDSNIGYTDTFSHGYWHFVDLPFTADGSKLPAVPAPNAATQIPALRTFIASSENDTLKSYDLIWLEHIVGDIHQPLHATTRILKGGSDLNGLKVNIKLSQTMINEFTGGNPAAFPPTELHAFWDDLPGEASSTNQAVAIAYASALSPALPTAVADTNPLDWANESFATGKSDVYATPIAVGLGTYTMTETYRAAALKDAQLRIALAGARLAKLLNENLR